MDININDEVLVDIRVSEDETSSIIGTVLQKCNTGVYVELRCPLRRMWIPNEQIVAVNITPEFLKKKLRFC